MKNLLYSVICIFSLAFIFPLQASADHSPGDFFDNSPEMFSDLGVTSDLQKTNTDKDKPGPIITGATAIATGYDEQTVDLISPSRYPAIASLKRFNLYRNWQGKNNSPPV